MKGICPSCEKETDLEMIRAIEDIEVRGEYIKVTVEYYKCLSCGDEFDDLRSPTSITGSRYARIPFGPAPNKWRYFFAYLIEEGALRADEVFYPDVIGEQFTSVKNPDLTIFSETELMILT